MLHTLRHALRGLIRNPAFSAAAILTLGMGIGVNALVYSVTRAAFLKPLPYPHEAELVALAAVHADQDGKPIDVGVNSMDVVHFASDNHTLAAAGATWQMAFSVTGTGDPQTVQGGKVTAGMWNVFATRPIAGRTFDANEDDPNNAIVVISERYQRRAFPGRAANAIGRSIVIDGAAYRVIGVMPDGFSPILDNSDLWIPMGVNATNVQDTPNNVIAMMGRMKPGVTVSQVTADLKGVAANLEKQYPVTHTKWSARAIPLRENIRGSVGALAISMTLAVVFLLVLACANISNLTLARVMMQRADVSTRLALGGSAGGIIAAQMSEGALLGVGGGVFGLAIAALMLHPLLTLAGPNDPILGTATIDANVVLVIMGVSVLVGVTCALLAGWYGVRAAARVALAGGGRRQSTSVADRRLRRLLMSAQVALATILLLGSIAMVATLQRLARAPIGFTTQHITAARLTLPTTRYPDTQHRYAFVREVIEHLHNTPGVTAAGMTNNRFALNQSMLTTVLIDGVPTPDDAGSTVNFRRAAGDYFPMLGLSPIQGRLFAESDRDSTIPVAIISKSFATRFFRNTSPVGQRIRRHGNANPWLTIVGVVPDVQDAGAGVDLGPAIYIPYAQNTSSAVTILVRSTLDGMAVNAALHTAVRAVDPLQAIDDVHGMGELVDLTLGQQKFKAAVLASLSILALLLACTGVAGVTAFVIAQRTQEIGLRMAIGSTRTGIVRLLLGETARWIAPGVAFGLVAGRALIMASTKLLPEVAHTPAVMYAAAAAALVIAGILAATLPTLRAARIPPSIALRGD